MPAFSERRLKYCEISFWKQEKLNGQKTSWQDRHGFHQCILHSNNETISPGNVRLAIYKPRLSCTDREAIHLEPLLSNKWSFYFVGIKVKPSTRMEEISLKAFTINKYWYNFLMNKCTRVMMSNACGMQTCHLF